MSDKKDPNKKINTAASFLSRALEAVSNDVEGTPEQKTTNQPKKPLTRQAFQRRIIGGLATVAVFVLLLIVYVVLNPGQAIFLNAVFGIDYLQIQKTLEYMIYIVFGGVCTVALIILIFFLYKVFTLKTKYWRKRLLVWTGAFMSMLVFFGLLGSFAAVYARFQQIDFANLDQQVLLYNNDLYIINDADSKDSARMEQLTGIYGPIVVRYDLSSYMRRLYNTTGLSNVEPYRYEIDLNSDGEIDVEGAREIAFPISEPGSALIIGNFIEPGSHQPIGKIYGVSVAGDPLEIDIDFPEITIVSTVQVEEVVDDTGGIRVNIDATSLQNSGNIEWYIQSEGPEPVFSGFRYAPNKVFFDTDIICLDVRSTPDNSPASCDWTYVVRGASDQAITADLVAIQDGFDPLTWQFRLDDLEVKNGEIKQITWYPFEGREFVGTFLSAREEILDFTFPRSGDHRVRVEVFDTAGNFRSFETFIFINAQVELKEGFTLQMTDGNGDDIISGTYDRDSNLYIIDGVSAPAKVTFDASRVRSDSPRLKLETVTWDFNDDGVFEEEGELIVKNFFEEDTYPIRVRYEFSDLADDETVSVAYEQVSLNTESKEIDVRIDISTQGVYAPVRATFDATSSRVLSGEIAKFVYDFGDGSQPINGEGVITYNYSEPGEYIATVTAVKTNGDEDSRSVTIVVKEGQSTARMRSSLASGRIQAGKPVTFDAFGTIGTIKQVTWNFGDGTILKQGNRISHIFSEAGTYEIEMTVEFESGILDSQTREYVVTSE